jgi:hypothetical protein
MAALSDADKQPSVPVVIRPPFQKELTVIMTKDGSAEQADADIEAIKNGSTVFRMSVPELYFHQLRLRAAQDPTLASRIAVFYMDKDNVMQPVGLEFGDQLKWPVGFCNEIWDLEVAIQQTRKEKSPAAHPISSVVEAAPAKQQCPRCQSGSRLHRRDVAFAIDAPDRVCPDKWHDTIGNAAPQSAQPTQQPTAACEECIQKYKLQVNGDLYRGSETCCKCGGKAWFSVAAERSTGSPAAEER